MDTGFSRIVNFLLIVAYFHQCKVLSHIPSQEFMEPGPSADVISPRILNNFQQDKGDDHLHLPTSDFEISGNEEPTLPIGSENSEIFHQFSNREHFLTVLKQFVDSEIRKKENRTRLISPRKMKFPSVEREAYGRGGLYSENVREGNPMTSPPEILNSDMYQDWNTRIPNPTVTIPILPNQNPHPTASALEERPHYRPRRPIPSEETQEYASYDHRHPQDSWTSSSQSSKTPKLQAYGDYSWTIEKASPDLFEMDGILTAEEIYKAIYEAEKGDTVRHQHNPKLQIQAMKNIQQKLQLQNQYDDGGGGNIQSGSSHYHPDYNSKGWGDGYSKDNFKHSRPLGSPSSSYGYKSQPPKVNREHSYTSQGGWEPEYNSHGNDYGDTYSHSGHSDGWMSKAKTFIHHIYHGSESHAKITRKVLEASIGIMAFLAFGAYLAALFLQSLLPKLALVPGIVRVNGTNPGLLGLLFGKSLNGVEDLYILRNETVEDLDGSVQRALHQANFRSKFPRISKGFRIYRM